MPIPIPLSSTTDLVLHGESLAASFRSAIRHCFGMQAVVSEAGLEAGRRAWEIRRWGPPDDTLSITHAGRKGKDYLTTAPSELIGLIFQHLSAKEWVAIQRVNKAWREFSTGFMNGNSSEARRLSSEVQRLRREAIMAEQDAIAEAIMDIAEENPLFCGQWKFRTKIEKLLDSKRNVMVPLDEITTSDTDSKPDMTKIRTILTVLSTSTSLETLALSAERMPDRCHCILNLLKQFGSHNTGLKRISLDLQGNHEKIGEPQCRQLGAIPKLISLNLAFTDQLTNKAVKELLKNQSLTHLNLSCTSLDRNALQRLAANTRLEFLHLADCQIGPRNARLFVTSHASNLNLSGNGIGLDAIIELIGNPWLQKLDVSLSCIFVSAQGNTPSSSRLLADRNGSMEQAITALGAALKKNRTLKTLNISDSGLDVGQVRSLIAALEDNVALTSLAMGDDSITNEQLQTLAPVLIRAKTLQSLDVSSSCEGRREAAKQLADTVRKTRPSFQIVVNDTAF